MLINAKIMEENPVFAYKKGTYALSLNTKNLNENFASLCERSPNPKLKSTLKAPSERGLRGSGGGACVQ